jgi:hypothetical protein
MLPDNWLEMPIEERKRWLDARQLVLYMGHLIAREMWEDHSSQIRKDIMSRFVGR